MMKPALFCALVLALAPVAAAAAPSALSADPPQDKAHPANMASFALPTTDGGRINAVLFTAAGAGAHPTVLLLHGLPGNEANFDIARAIQRAGWNVLTLHYRGSWGSPGVYSFAHCIEDGRAALAWLRHPRADLAAQIDPHRIAVVGHSLGAFIAAYDGARDPDVVGVGVLSLTRLFNSGDGAFSRDDLLKRIEGNVLNDAGMRTLGDTTSTQLTEETLANRAAWDLTSAVPGLARHPFLVVTSDDGNADYDNGLGDAVAARGGKVSRTHLATDHSYNDQRLTLTATILDWLTTL